MLCEGGMQNPQANLNACSCLTVLAWPSKENNENIKKCFKEATKQHYPNAKRATLFKCHVFLADLLKHHPCLPATFAQEALPDCKGDRVL